MGSPVGVFSQFCVYVLTIPASICRAESFSEWVHFWHCGGAFWCEMALNYSAERAYHPRSPITKQFVGLSTSVAAAIIKQGGILHLISTLFQVFLQEGLQGIRTRYSRTIPLPEIFKPSGLENSTSRILVSDHRIPRPDSSAGDFTTMGILRDAVALGYNVVFLAGDFAPSPEHADKIKELGVTVITAGCDYATPADYIAHEGYKFTTFYFIRLSVAEYLIPIARETAPDAKIIFHAPDLNFLREERQALIQKSPTAPARATRHRELAVIKKSNIVVVLSDVEKDILQQHTKATRIELFPALYAPVLDSAPGFSARKDIFFLGAFSHTPNIDAVMWFAKTIWPRIHAILPEASFQVIGADPTRQVLGLAKIPGVKVNGFVANLSPVLANIRLGVAPLRFGAGIKGKVALTMGARIPCICSPIAAEGMGIPHTCAFLLAKNDDDYIEKIVRLYQDEELWETLSKAGAALVKTQFGVDACKRRLMEILEIPKPNIKLCDTCLCTVQETREG